MTTNRPENPNFILSALIWSGSVTPRVVSLVLLFSFYALLVTVLFKDHPALELDIGPFEITGAVLGLLLVLRTNAGYDRWWEARKLWGGIVNQCRNLALTGLQYGPDQEEWRRDLIRWTASFPHVAKRSLRGERELPELSRLLSDSEIQSILAARHMPSFILKQIAHLIRSARTNKTLDDFYFLQIDKERALLMDHVGACERILKTPIPLVIAIKVRRFILLFLLFVPFVLMQKVGWYTPEIMVVIAYPLLALDQIGVELQSPFSKQNLSHLPLDDIATMIEEDLISLQK